MVHLRKFRFNGYKYHIITFDYECGFNEKPEVQNLKQAKEAASWYLQNGYKLIYATNECEIVKVYDKYNRSGRKPYHHEHEKFDFRKTEQPTQYELF